MLVQLRAQIKNLWDRLTRVQRIVLGVLLALGVGLIAAFSYWASVPEYAVAFSGLSEADAGAIVEKLKASNTPYQLQAGGTILVPKAQMYDVRLSMAKDGLPNGSTVGFELFNTNTLGLTEFSQKVNYQRALEGELARTIESLDAVKAARVHIVLPDQALFASQQQPTTASITLQLNPGKSLTRDQVSAITHLTASSVEGLKPSDVVVVNTEGTLLSAGLGGADQVTGLSDSQTEFQRQYEAAVQAKVQDMLLQALGPNKSIVRVSAQLNWDQIDSTQQTYQPTPVVRSNSSTNEVYNGAGTIPGGIPGASSNLPSGSAPTYQATGTQTANSAYQRTDTTTNYEISNEQTHTVVTPGQVKKLSVSVLVDNITDAAKLKSLTAIAGSAAGIDTTRGDVVDVQSMAFDRTYFDAETAAINSASQMDLYTKIGIVAGIILLGALLAWYVSRLMNNLRLTASQDIWTPLIGAPTQPLALATATAGAQPSLASGAAAGAPALAAAASAPAEPALPLILASRAKHQAETPELEQIQRVIVRLIEQRPATAAEIIRLWIEEDGNRK